MSWVSRDGGVSFPLLAPDGTGTTPSYGFSGQTHMGVYRVGTNRVCLSAAVGACVEVNGDNVVFNGALDILYAGLNQVNLASDPFTVPAKGSSSFFKYDNRGASGTVHANLPANSATQDGHLLWFVRQADFAFRIRPDAGDHFIGSMGAMADGEYLELGGVGSSMMIVRNDDGDWEILSEVGTLTEETP